MDNEKLLELLKSMPEWKEIIINDANCRNCVIKNVTENSRQIIIDVEER